MESVGGARAFEIVDDIVVHMQLGIRTQIYSDARARSPTSIAPEEDGIILDIDT